MAGIVVPVKRNEKRSREDTRQSSRSQSLEQRKRTRFDRRSFKDAMSIHSTPSSEGAAARDEQQQQQATVRAIAIGLRKHTSIPESLEATEPTSAAATKQRKAWAVRVGWLPGIYLDFHTANAQTYRYPKGEWKRFDSIDCIEEARTWLARPSLNTGNTKDGLVNTDTICHNGWTGFLRHTWTH